MKTTNISKFFLLLIAVAALFTSCSTISFAPKVSLDVSPERINKTVKIERFTDSSPAEDRVTPFMGNSVTDRKALAGDLDLQITNEITSDFAVNGVFKEVSRNTENPDYIIKGEIKRFKGISKVNTFGKIYYFSIIGLAAVAGAVNTEAAWGAYILTTSIPFFGVPVTRNISEIEIVLNVYDKNNNLVGTYTGKADNTGTGNIYHNTTLAINSMTNETLSKAVMQVREQILKDKSKFSN